MKTYTLTIGGKPVTVKNHIGRIYSIHFEDESLDAYGEMLDIVKAFAEWQTSTLDEPSVSFEYNEQDIGNPWSDPSARYPFDDMDACRWYGAENVMRFIMDACEILRPNE